MYIKKKLVYDVVKEQHDMLKVISAVIKLKSDKVIKISGLYRCHDYMEEQFLENFKIFVASNSNMAKHVIMGDTYMDVCQSVVIILPQ